MYDFNVLVAPLLAYLSCLCMFTCLLVRVTKPHSRIGFRVGLQPSIYTKPWDPLWGASLVGMCVVRNSIKWIYWYNPNLHLLHISIYFPFVWLFISMVSFFCLLACLPISLCLFACFVWGFSLLHVADWACTLLPRRSKRALISRF